LTAACNGPSRNTPILDTGSSLEVSAVTHLDSEFVRLDGAVQDATRPLDPESLGSHVARLYRAAYGLCGSRQDAEDLVQDTFERVLRRPRFIRRDEDLVYLLRVLRNTWISSRRAKRQVATSPAGEEIEHVEARTIRSRRRSRVPPCSRRCRG